MIWIYYVNETDFVALDVTSFTQLKEIARDRWIWIDVFSPSEKEIEILTELFGNEPKVVENFRKLMDTTLDLHYDSSQLYNYERINKYGSVIFPSISITKELLIYPIILAKKKRLIITWAEEGGKHSRIIKKTIRRLREGVEAKQDLNSSLVISVLFHEVAIKNSNQILSIREKIDQLEEQALEKGGKDLIHSVFSLKKMISNLYRLMIEEKAFMLDVDKSVLPLISLDEKSKPIVDEAIEIIDREIDILDSYSRSLDSILTLADLTSIHKVESSINNLTIVLVIGTAILIFLEILKALKIA
jgi:Mg2+ and Co2+ transporter CorA